ncbi:MAG: TRAP transporter substrate-binding protein [Sphaerochaeta sp.]|nr:TRAP transporter substrate-binding protein [Sphaerochaeta sp.]
MKGNKRRYFFVFLLVISLVGSLAFANGTSEKASQGPVKIIAAHVNSLESSYQSGMVAFKEELERISNGTMTVEVHANGALGGGEEELVQKMATGTVDVIVASPNFLAQVEPRADIFSLPYLFADTEHWLKTTNGEPGREIAELIDNNTDFKVLGYWMCGVRSYFGTRPVTSKADFAGVKIRVHSSPVVQKSWQALGAQPANVAYNELYQGLQNKVIDAAEQDLGNIYLQKFYEAGKYISLTEHDIATRFFLIGGKKFKTLTDEQQKWVQEAGAYASKIEHEADLALSADSRAKLEKAGAIFNTVDKETFIALTEPVRQEAAKSMKAETLLSKISSLQ